VLCHTPDLKAPQPGFFFKSQVQMSYPVDGNSAYSLISRQLFFCVLHFERNHGFVPGSCTLQAYAAGVIRMAQSLLKYENALCSQARCVFPPSKVPSLLCQRGLGQRSGTGETPSEPCIWESQQAHRGTRRMKA
jgi:hypothetical protein